MKQSSLITFYVGLGLTFLLLAGRLLQMQLVEGGLYQSQADDNRIRIVTTKAIRGVVYDRNDRQLISNRPSYSVGVTKGDLPEDEIAQKQVFTRLAQLLETQDVVTAVPEDLPTDRADELTVIQKLADIMKVPVTELQGTVDGAGKVSPKSPALLRRELDDATVTALQAAIGAGQLTGVQVMNEIEYTFITRFEKPFSAVTVKRDIPYETMQQIEEDHFQLPGVSVNPEPVRQYEDGTLMSHLLGYVGPISEQQYQDNLPVEGSGEQPIYDHDDKVGQLGIELSMEETLRGRKGVRRVEVNSSQREVRELLNVDPVPGNNVVLTIDSQLQAQVAQYLQQGINDAGGADHKVHAGVAIVEKVQTGEVLAMVSLPSYDNNLFASGISQEDFDKLNNDTNNPMFNRATSGAYPPGSTFKMITAAAGLQEGVITPDKTYFCPGHINVPYTYDDAHSNPYKCWKAAGHGSLNVVQALEQSCDVFFYEVAGPAQLDALGKMTRFYNPGAKTPTYFDGLGIDKLDKYMAQFGLGAKTGIEMPGENPGLIPSPAWKVDTFPGDNWSLGDTLVAGIGQSYHQVTPLQLTNVTAAIANGGTLYRPRLVYQVKGPDGGTIVQDFKPDVIHQVSVSADNLAVVRQGLFQAVNGAKATAYRTKLKDVVIAGKTGTAEIGEELTKADGTKYRNAHAWFTGFAPYDKPEIAVTVLIEAGEQSLEGSTFAVPVAKQIFQAYFHVTQ